MDINITVYERRETFDEYLGGLLRIVIRLAHCTHGYLRLNSARAVEVEDLLKQFLVAIHN